MVDPLRIVFMGSDAIALPMLDWIAQDGAALGAIVAVYTQPDRPVGRGQKVLPNAIKCWALDRGLPVLQPEKLNTEAPAELAALRPDIALVMAYGHLLKDEFIAVPRLGTLNLHASLLPAYRGASPIQTAVAEGDSRTGVSLMRIVRKLDAGPVADQESFCIEPLDTGAEAEAKMAKACVPLLARKLAGLAVGTLHFREQDESKATFCRKLTKEDGRVDWRRPAAKVAARINGLNPWPGCSVVMEGQVIKLGLAEGIAGPSSADPGTILQADRSGILVATGEGAVRLLRLQRPGGRMLPVAEFINGFPLAVGARFESAELLPLVSAQPFRQVKSPPKDEAQ